MPYNGKKGPSADSPVCGNKMQFSINKVILDECFIARHIVMSQFCVALLTTYFPFDDHGNKSLNTFFKLLAQIERIKEGVGMMNFIF